MRDGAFVRRAVLGLRGGLLGAALLAPAAARADRRPTLASDAFYIGARVDPGVALVGAWDVDIYLGSSRAFSLGPGVSVSVLGTAAGARAQDLLVAVDLVRLKVGLNTPGGAARPFLMLGGGFSYVRLPDPPALDEFAPMITLGAGADLFTDGPVGVTAAFATRFHPSGSDRVPDEWIEVVVGLRFGL